MGTSENPRRRGIGGLYIRKTKIWNEVKNDYEVVDYYQATKEIKDPDNPEKRKRITGTARTPEQAQKNLQESIARYYKKQALEEVGIVPQTRKRSGLTVEEFMLQWFEYKSKLSIDKQLKLKYWGHIKNHINPNIGHIYLSALTTSQLDHLFGETLAKKKKVVNGVETEEPHFGTNGLRNVYKTLNQALNYAKKHELIRLNPMMDVEAPAYKQPEENIPLMMNITIGMFKKMLEVGDTYAYNHFLIALLGLRRGERLGLTWEMVRFDGRYPKLTIKYQLARTTGEGLHIKPTTKNKTDRSVVLFEPFLSLMKELRKNRKFQERLPDFKPAPEFADLVFLKDDGKPYDLNEDNDFWREVEAKYNNKHKPKIYIRGHALRHIAATYMGELGVDEKVAKAIFGHKSEAIYHYYTRITHNKQLTEMGKVQEDLTLRLKPEKALS